MINNSLAASLEWKQFGGDNTAYLKALSYAKQELIFTVFSNATGVNQNMAMALCIHVPKKAIVDQAYFFGNSVGVTSTEMYSAYIQISKTQLIQAVFRFCGRIDNAGMNIYAR